MSRWWPFGSYRRRRGGRRARRHVPPPPPPCPDGFLYALGPGDNPTDLAARFHVGLAELAGANPQVRDWRRLAAGQLICVPARVPFAVCLLLRPTGATAPEAAGVLLARREPAVGVQLLLAATGLPAGGERCVAQFERQGEIYLSLPMEGGLATAREPGGALVHFDRVAVRRDGVPVLEAWGRDSLPGPPASPLGPF